MMQLTSPIVFAGQTSHKQLTRTFADMLRGPQRCVLSRESSLGKILRKPSKECSILLQLFKLMIQDWEDGGQDLIRN